MELSQVLKHLEDGKVVQTHYLCGVVKHTKMLNIPETGKKMFASWWEDPNKVDIDNSLVVYADEKYKLLEV